MAEPVEGAPEDSKVTPTPPASDVAPEGADVAPGGTKEPSPEEFDVVEQTPEQRIAILQAELEAAKKALEETKEELTAETERADAAEEELGTSNEALEAEKAAHQKTKEELAGEKDKVASTGAELEKEKSGHAATKAALDAEKAAHGKTQGDLKAEQEEHAKTQETLESTESELEETKTTLAETDAAKIKAEAELGRRDLNDGKTGDERSSLEAIAKEHDLSDAIVDKEGNPLNPDNAYTFKGKDTRAIAKAEEDLKKSPDSPEAKEALKQALGNAAANGTVSIKVKAEDKAELDTNLTTARVKDGIANDHEQAVAVGDALAKMGVLTEDKGVYGALKQGSKQVDFTSNKGLANLDKAIKQATDDGIITDAEKLKLASAYEGAVKPGVSNVSSHIGTVQKQL